MRHRVLPAVLGVVAAPTAITVSVRGDGPSVGGPRVDAASAARSSAESRARAAQQYASLPVTFVENAGETDPSVRYHAQGFRYGFFLTPVAMVLSLVTASEAPTPLQVDRPPRAETNGVDGVALELGFVGANPGVVLQREQPAPGTFSYLKGDDPTRWHAGLSGYDQVVYRDWWSGVDLAVRGRGGELKYKFRVRPGARVDGIRLAYRGADALTLDDTGAMLVRTALGVLLDSAPVSYQEVGSTSAPVESRYLLTGASDGRPSYGFTVGRGYDPDRELIIDPGLAYSTFLGGFGNQTGDGIAVDASSDAYITGFTQSPTFPTTPGAFDRAGSVGNDLDAFVTKLNATGTALVYSTFLGGSNFEWGRAITTDSAGNAYVTGQTKSSNFPTTGGAFDRTFNVDNCPRCGIDQYDAFVTKLNPTGSGLVYSTFVGGTSLDDSLGIAVDGARNAYVAGETSSGNFPTTPGALDTTANGGNDVVVTKLNASGSALVYSTRLGGADNETPVGIAVDAAGNASVGGGTRSADLPTTAGAFDRTRHGTAFDQLFDGFVTKVNAAGSALVFSTFVGGANSDFASDFAVDSAGKYYLTGSTLSPDFPTTPGTFDSTFSGSESFVTKLNSNGSVLVCSTFLGESGASAIAPDANGNAWLAGSTSSPTAFTTPDAFDPQFSGGVPDAYVAELNPTGSALVYATFLGGTDNESGSDVAVDPSGNAYVTGQTRSGDFPTTAGAVDRTYSGDAFIMGGEAFVAKFAVGLNAPPPPPPPPPVPPAPTLVSPADGATTSLPVTFDWTDVAGAASYNIQVDEISAFGAPLILDATATASQFTSSSLPGGNWFWRARAVNSAGTPGPWSAVRTIQVQSAPPPPPAPTGPLPSPSQLNPANDARFTPGQSITFDWSDVNGAASYTIQIDDSDTFSAPLTADQTVSTSQWATTTLPTTRMWWRVRANDGSGAPGTWSAARRFEIRS
jgi:hypothetical protein